jgi:hypothetical protein
MEKRRILHGKFTLIYFLVSGLYGLFNVATHNTGPGIFVLILAHTLFDSLWILVDPDLRKERTGAKALHHLGITGLTIGTWLYKPWTILTSYGIIVELSGFVVYVMKIYPMSESMTALWAQINMLSTIFLRFALPLYGPLLVSRWWDGSHPLVYVVLLFIGLAFLIVPNVQWTWKIYRNGWRVSCIHAMPARLAERMHVTGD